MQYPIDRYVIALVRRLPLDAAETAAIVEEVRAHLEEAAAHALEGGMDRQAAEQQAVAAFGKPGALARRLASAHPARWDVRRIVGAGFLGGLVVWALWTATAYPLVVNNALNQLAYNSVWPDKTSLPLHLLILSTPLSLVSVGELSGQHWLLPVLLLYLILPYAWGLRAKRWLLPGLAYGLGAALLNPLTYGLLFVLSTPTDSSLLNMSMLALVVLPLAVLASGLGYAWRVSSPGLITRCGAVVLSRLPGQRVLAINTQQMALQPRSALASLSRRRLSLKWVIFSLIIVAILAVEIVSFARIWNAAHQPALTPSQQLAQAQARTPFPIHQPAFLPVGAHLTQVFFDHCSMCGNEASSTVQLIYTLAAPSATVELEESNARINPPQGSYQDSARHQHPLEVNTSTISLGDVSAAVMISKGFWSDGSPFYRYDILWTRGSVSYLLSEMGLSASLGDLERIAASI
ncbi:MAG TPA: permease prefix domain 1-containing protein [Ktedonobacterales bacterium]|jgi:hypothetical protein